MTQKLPCTQALVRRLIAAARKEGLRITAIRPDGTILVHDGDAPLVPDATERLDGAPSRWLNVKA